MSLAPRANLGALLCFHTRGAGEFLEHTRQMESSRSAEGQGGSCHIDTAPADNYFGPVPLILVEVSPLLYLALLLQKLIEFPSWKSRPVVLSPACTLESLQALKKNT